MRERPVPQRGIRTKTEHPPRELLVRDVHDLRVVVGVATTMRPPGLVTRTISASAASGSERCWNTRSAQQPSKLESANGSASALATCAARRPRRRASSTIVLDTSTPATLTRNRLASPSASAPLPQPTSTYTRPSTGSSSSATRRLYAS